MVTTHGALCAFLTTVEEMVAAGFRELRGHPAHRSPKQRQAMVQQLRVMGNLFHQIADRVDEEPVRILH